MHQPFDNELLVAIYDHDNPDGADHNFYRHLAHTTEAQGIADIGCGTGILTVTLVGQGRAVTGIDPSATMLAYARARPGSGQVTWVEGTSSALEVCASDLVLMTGNVAMHIIGEDWQHTLQDIAEALTAGGTLAFEVRNPLARAWEQWPVEGQSGRLLKERSERPFVFKAPIKRAGWLWRQPMSSSTANIPSQVS